MSLFTDSARLAEALAKNDADLLEADPLVREQKAIAEYIEKFSAPMKEYNAKRRAFDRIYVRGLCEMYDWAKAPDANFTLRMTYGHVTDLKPRDAVRYDWRTVLDGMFEKRKQNGERLLRERAPTPVL